MISPLTLARYSQLAYEAPEAVQAAIPGAKVTFLDRDDSQAYVIEEDQHTVVAFRGTQVTSGFSMTDILRNAKLAKGAWRPGLQSGGKVHQGYKEAVDAIAGDLYEAIMRTKKPRIYTGHSLGGSMATLARTLEPHPELTVTFGAPKVGNRDFVKAYSHIRLVRYVHGQDIAPKHARIWMGYGHGGALRKLSHNGQVSKRPWYWGDEIILPFGLTAGTFDHRIGEYVAKLRGAEV